MAWRPTDCLIEGELDNRVLGKVTGWMRFAGIKERIVFDLDGDFHRDIRGAKVRLRGDGESANQEESEKNMEGFAKVQTGEVGDMTAGREPVDYVKYPYWEWYSDENGRVVIELEHDQVEILTSPIPACESDPIDRKKQAENMANFLSGMASACGIPQEHAISTGNTVAVEQARKVLANNKIRGMKLLPQEIREILPPLYSQEDKNGKAVVYAKYFCPSSSWTWYATEFDGQDTFFGLVEGFEKELGYFNLSELESITGPMGLPIERDLYWKPKTLAEIAPEMFSEESK
jgi:hypothetical protein